MRTAVVVSILAHASLIGAAGLRKPSSAPAELAPPVDVWAGTTALPTGSEELVDVDSLGSLGPLGGSSPETLPALPAAPAAPSGNDSADEIPIEPEPPPVVPDKPSEPEKPKAKEPTKAPEADKPKADPPKAEKPAPPDKPAKPEKPEEKAPEKAPDKVPDDKDAEKKDPETKAANPEEQAPNYPDKPVADAEKKPAKVAKRPKPGPAPAAAANTDGNADGKEKSASGSFGAEGTATVRDLGRAFARALPAASSPEKGWAGLAVGSKAAIEVAVTIGEEGKVAGFEVLSKDPPAILVSAVKKTVDMLKYGSFMRAGETATAGRNVFKIVAEASDREVTEEDVSGAAAFGLGSTWEGRQGTAHFTQVSGRHVEMTVEFVRALPAKE